MSISTCIEELDVIFLHEIEKEQKAPLMELFVLNDLKLYIPITDKEQIKIIKPWYDMLAN